MKKRPLLAAEKRCCSCVFPIQSKLPSPFLQCRCQKAGTWFPPGVCCTFFRKRRGKKKSITAVHGGNVKFWLPRRCAEFVASFNPSSPPDRSGTRVSGAGWEGSQAPCTISSCPALSCRSTPLPGVRSKAQARSAFASKPSIGSFDPPWPVAFCSSPPATAAAIHSPSFSPHHVWHCRASLPLVVFAPSLLASLLSFCLN